MSALPNDGRSLALRSTRPAVTRVFRGATLHDWGLLVVFHGTREALIAAGVADDVVLAAAAWPTGWAEGRDEYGDEFAVYASRGGSYSVRRYCHAEIARDPVDARGRRRKLWRQHGPAVTAVVDAAIKRFKDLGSANASRQLLVGR